MLTFSVLHIAKLKCFVYIHTLKKTHSNRNKNNHNNNKEKKSTHTLQKQRITQLENRIPHNEKLLCLLENIWSTWFKCCICMCKCMSAKLTRRCGLSYCLLLSVDFLLCISLIIRNCIRCVSSTFKLHISRITK